MRNDLWETLILLGKPQQATELLGKTYMQYEKNIKHWKQYVFNFILSDYATEMLW